VEDQRRGVVSSRCRIVSVLSLKRTGHLQGPRGIVRVRSR
jgi:hypothetical protein